MSADDIGLVLGKLSKPGAVAGSIGDIQNLTDGKDYNDLASAINLSATALGQALDYLKTFEQIKNVPGWGSLLSSGGGLIAKSMEISGKIERGEEVNTADVLSLISNTADFTATMLDVFVPKNPWTVGVSLTLKVGVAGLNYYTAGLSAHGLTAENQILAAANLDTIYDNSVNIFSDFNNDVGLSFLDDGNVNYDFLFTDNDAQGLDIEFKVVDSSGDVILSESNSLLNPDEDWNMATSDYSIDILDGSSSELISNTIRIDETHELALENENTINLIDGTLSTSMTTSFDNGSTTENISVVFSNNTDEGILDPTSFSINGIASDLETLEAFSRVMKGYPVSFNPQTNSVYSSVAQQNPELAFIFDTDNSGSLQIYHGDNGELGVAVKNEDGSEARFYQKSGNTIYDQLPNGSDGMVVRHTTSVDGSELTNVFLADGQLNVGVIGGMFGSTIGNLLAEEENQFTQFAASAIFTAMGDSLAEAVVLTIGGKGIEEAFSVGFSDIVDEIESIAKGAVTSFLVAEMIDVLDLDAIGGVGGDLANIAATEALTGAVNTAINAESISAVTDVKWAEVGSAIETSIYAYIGTRLGQEIYDVESREGAIGGALGASIGAYYGSVVPGVGTVIGAAIGYVAGALFGDLFGSDEEPRASADVIYDEETKQFIIGNFWHKDTHAAEPAARQFAQSVADALNNFVAATGGEVVNDRTEWGTYLMYKGSWILQGEGMRPGTRGAPVDELVEEAVFANLSRMTITGGDEYVKAAMYQTVDEVLAQANTDYLSYADILAADASVPTEANDLFKKQRNAVKAFYRQDYIKEENALQDLSGAMTIAADYSRYKQNEAAINAIISAEPHSAFTAGWLITLQQADDLNLNELYEFQGAENSIYADLDFTALLGAGANIPDDIGYLALIPPGGSGGGAGGTATTGSGGSGLSIPRDPFVLDLDGDGVELISLDDSTALFDLNGDGTATRTAWLSADDGFLVLDGMGEAQADGVINNIHELFGSPERTGYEELSELDTNFDNIIDANDTQFSELNIWQDVNGDGISQSDELRSVTQVGIESISLDYQDVTGQTGTAQIARQGSFKWVSGLAGVAAETSGLVGDVLFATNPTITQFTGEYTLDPAVNAVGNINGFGQMPDLHIAMSLNNDLKDYTLGLLSTPSALSLVTNFDEFLAKWADVESITIDDIDANHNLTVNTDTGMVDFALANESFTLQQLGVIKQYSGMDTLRLGDGQWREDGQLVTTGEYYRQAYNELSRNLLVKVAIANGLLEDILPAMTYDADTDLLMLDGFIEEVTLASDDPEANMRAMIALVALVEIDPSSRSVLSEAIDGYIETNGLGEFYTTFANPIFKIMDLDSNIIFGDDAKNIIAGGSGADVLLGGGGDDTLSGGSHNGNDTLHGGIGNDYLYDQYGGNDTYLFNLGDGEDRIYDANGTDRIKFGAGITPEMLRRYTQDNPTSSYDDLVFSIDGTSEKVIFQSWERGSNYQLEEFEFVETNETLNLTQMLSRIAFPVTEGKDVLSLGGNSDTVYAGAGSDTIAADSGNDTIWGEAGHDSIDGGHGNDVLYGGAGDDTLAGGSHSGNDTLHGGIGNDYLYDQYGGNDTYLFNLGDGEDRIYDANGTDRLAFGAGITPEMLRRYTQDNATSSYDDLVLSIDGTTDKVILQSWERGTTYQFESFYFLETDENLSRAMMLERIAFPVTEGKDVLSLGGNSDTVYAGAGSDTIAADSGNDTIWGEAGHDSIDGGHGNDVLYGGAGDDTLAGGSHSGNDTLHGGIGNDYLYDQYGGNDTYLFNLGDGEDRIYDANGTDRIKFGAGITPEMLRRYTQDNSTSSYDDLVFSIDGTSDKVIFQSWERGSNYQLEEFEFVETNEILNLIQMLSRIAFALTDNKDVLSLGGNSDTVYAGAGSDTIAADSGNDTIWGEAGHDSIDGGHGNDVLYGGAGDDTLAGGSHSGNDTLHGGIGNDYLYDQYGGNDTYLFNLGDGEDRIYDANGTDRLAFGAGITPEMLRRYTQDNPTSSYDDLVLSIDGTTDKVILQSWERGTIYQFESFYFLETDENLSRAMMLERIAFPVTEGKDVLSLGGNSDTVYAGAGSDTIAADSGNDTIWGEAGHDSIDGGHGNDVLYGGAGDDTLAGGSHSGNDTLHGGVGNDYLYDQYGGNDTYLFNLGDGEDRIYDANGTDRIKFGAGITPEMLRRYTQDNSTSSYDDLVFSIEGTSEKVIFQSWERGSNFQLERFEFVETSETLNLTQMLNRIAFDVTEGKDVLSLGNYSDTVYAGAGSDSIAADSGNDTIWGEAGHDSIDGGYGNDVLYGGEGNDTLAGGSHSGNDTLHGGVGNDYLYDQYGGNDTYLFNLGDGEDRIYDANGTDKLIFGAGITPDMLTRDLIRINGSSYDALSINLSGTSDVVNLDSWSRGNVFRIEAITFQETNYSISTNLFLSTIGTTGNDNLIGSSSNNVLVGSTGNDQLNGGQGNDTLIGGQGNDTYTFSDGFGTDVINNDTAAASDVDIIRFTSDITEEMVNARQNGSDLVLHSGLNSVVVENFYTRGAPINSVFFDAGGSWDLTTLAPNFTAIDDSSNIIREHLSDGNNYYSYDNSGRKIFSINGAGIVSETRYDTSSRITDRITYSQSISSQLALWIQDNPGKAAPSASDISGFFSDFAQSEGQYRQQLFANSDAHYDIDNRWQGDDTWGITDVIRDRRISGTVGTGTLESSALTQTLDLSAYDTSQSLKLGLGASHFSNSNLQSRWIIQFFDIDGNDLGAEISTNGVASGEWQDESFVFAIPDGAESADVSLRSVVAQPAKGTPQPVVADTPIFFDNLRAEVFPAGDTSDFEAEPAMSEHTSFDYEQEAVVDNNKLFLFSDLVNSDFEAVSIDSVIEASAVNGTVSVNAADKTISFLSADGFTGQASFDVVINDEGALRTETIIVTVEKSIHHSPTDGDNYAGTAAADTVYGNAGNDILHGDAKDDWIGGYGGNDTLLGEAGNDTLLAGIGDDMLFGGIGDDSLVANAGNNQLFGEAGDDSLTSGTGSDTLTGGLGSDLYIYSSGSGADIIDNTAADNDATNDRLLIQNISAANTILSKGSSWGGSADDLVIKFINSETDSITIKDYFASGSPGDLDQIYFNGADSAIVWTRADIEQAVTLIGTSANETIQDTDSNRQVLMGLDGDDLLQATLGGNDTIYGGDGNDQLISAGGGQHALFGEAGNDWLIGIAGDDYLSGGTGNDTYYFQADISGDDVINNASSSWTDDIDQLNLFSADKDSTWFTQEGNDLLIEFVGEDSSVTVQNWFLHDTNKLDGAYAQGGQQLDFNNAAFDQLVFAMAAHTDRSGIVGADGIAPVDDSNLTNAITAAWQTNLVINT